MHTPRASADHDESKSEMRDTVSLLVALRRGDILSLAAGAEWAAFVAGGPSGPSLPALDSLRVVAARDRCAPAVLAQLQRLSPSAAAVLLG